MTLDELNAHLYLMQKLNTARDMLQSLRDSALRASSYDGMPHTPGAGDKVAALAIKCAELEETVSVYAAQAGESEKSVKAWISTILDSRTNLIFYLRFICGYEWREVAEVIGGRNTEAAVKSQAYRYLESTGDAF